MSKAKFIHHDLRLVEPAFGSELTDLIIELEHLRKKELGGTTHPSTFFQLKNIFHFLESLGSARIEGNNTTITEYIETKIDQTTPAPPDIREIQNIEEAMSFIEDHLDHTPINRMLISEIHRMVVKGLNHPPNGEGDKTPGKYRSTAVAIGKSNHKPPDTSIVNEYMEDLFRFINQKDSPKHDLLKIAIAHHRFAWIHPFTNGNGRTVRLFTYAMLVKLGFKVNIGRILNPTAIFCNNRDLYYRNLALADTGTDDGILNWCQYVLKGLKDEIEKIDKLSDYTFLKNEILLPTLQYSFERQYVTEDEAKILKRVIEKQVIQAADITEFFPGKADSQVSREITKLIQKKMIAPEAEGKRKYVLRFDNNYLLRGIIRSLGEKGFLSVKD